MPQGKLIVVSGPSGVGKRTLVEHARTRFPRSELSVSATTRAPRPGERPGVDYHFMSQSEFEKLIADDGFLEWAKYADNFYGTPKGPVTKWREQGRLVFMEVDVQGARQVIRQLPEAITIFIYPPEPRIETLRKRLLARQAKTKEDINIEKRLRTAEEELAHMKLFKYQIENNELERAERILVHVLALHLNQCVIS